MNKRLPPVLLTVLLAFSSGVAYAKWVWTPETGWFRSEAIPRMSPEDTFQRAKDHYEAGDFKHSLSGFRSFLRLNPSHSLAEEALSFAAKAAFGTRDFWKAHKLSVSYLDKYPAGQHASELIKLEYNAGLEFFEGSWRRVYGIPLLPGAGAGRKVMETILERAPYHSLADDAQLKLADYYFREEVYDEARLACELLLMRYPDRETAEDAQFMLALSSLLYSQGIEYDAGELQDAAGEFQLFAASYPRSPDAEAASILFARTYAGLARKDLLIAVYYLKRGRRDAAAVYLRSVAGRYPTSDYAQAARTLLDALKSGTSTRRVLRQARGLDEEAYSARPRLETLERDLERLGL